MPFEAAQQYVDKYRDKRIEALDNKRRIKWFTTEAGELGALVAKFNSDAENQEWSTEFHNQDGGDSFKMIAARLKVNYLTSWRQDIRDQYAIDMLESEVGKTAMDTRAQDYCLMKELQWVAEEFKYVVEEYKKGKKSL